METVKFFLREHTLALILALSVGALSVLPTVVAPLALGDEYKGVSFLPLDDEDIYLARIHEVLDGYPSVSSPYFHEYKDAPLVVPPLNEWLYALPAFLFGLKAVVVASKFVFPALLFFLVYLLIRRMTDGEDHEDAVLASLTGALLVTLGFDFVDYHALLNLAHGVPPKFLIWDRLVNPITGALQIFGFLILLRALFVKQSHSLAVFGGVLLASMVGYFFAFGASLAVLGVAITVSILTREWAQVRDFLLLLGVSVIVDIPYWYMTLHTVGGEAGKALSLRNGMFFTHAPVFNKFLVATILFVLIAYGFATFIKQSRSRAREWQFLAVLLLGCLVMYNQQILTGREIWHQHFVQYVIPICFVSIVLSLFYSLRLRYAKIWRVLMLFLCVLSFLYGVSSIFGVSSRLSELSRQQSYVPVFTFLEQNASKSCVVMVLASDEELARLIPGYTHCDVTDVTYTFIGVTKERILHNFLLRMRLQGVAVSDARTYLLDHELDIRYSMFSDWNQLFGHGRNQWVLDQVLFLEGEYKKFAQSDLKEELLRYQVDYIISTTPLKEDLLTKLPGLSVVGVAGRFYIYSF